MLSILPEVQHFGVEDESNKINKENMNEFCIFILLTKNRKIQNIKQNTKSKPCASVVERRTKERSSKRNFSMVKHQ